MDDTNYQTIIVGGGYAGMICAVRLAGKAGKRTRIALVAPNRLFVERSRLHEKLAVCADARSRPLELAPLLAGLGVDFIEGKRSVRIDGGRRSQSTRRALNGLCHAGGRAYFTASIEAR